MIWDILCIVGPWKIRIRNNLIKVYRLCQSVGFEPRKLVSLALMGRFIAEWHKYNRLNPRPSLRIEVGSLWPVLTDYHGKAGYVSDAYFHEDLWAARKIYAARPPRHVDVGSRIDGFVAHLLVFMPVEYVDIRPMEEPVRDLTVIQADATSLEMFPDNSISSLSSLNVAEHFGLGRFSDPVDPMACFTFMSSLARVLAPGGSLYFSTPVGRERVEFNAHRIFALHTVLSCFSCLKLVSFSYVDDYGRLFEDVQTEEFPPQADFACGLFEFTK